MYIRFKGIIVYGSRNFPIGKSFLEMYVVSKARRFSLETRVEEGSQCEFLLENFNFYLIDCKLTVKKTLLRSIRSQLQDRKCHQETNHITLVRKNPWVHP